MADLDDFFAKKDRKKAKGVKKFTTTEEIAKKLEETGKKVEKPKPKEKPVNLEGGDDENQSQVEEDEWRDYEEEKKDYTGLKIGNLTVNDNSYDDEDMNRDTGDNSSDNEAGDGGSKHSGPWKKPELPEPSAEPKEPEKPAPEPVKATGGVYKPPSMLRKTNVGPGSNSSKMKKKNVAPDISSEEYFPTLNSKPPTADAGGAWGKKKPVEENFEEVRNRGNRAYNTQESQDQAPKLSLGNKYGALPQDQS